MVDTISFVSFSRCYSVMIEGGGYIGMLIVIKLGAVIA